MMPGISIGSLVLPMYPICIGVGGVFFIITLIWQLKLTHSRIQLGPFLLTFIFGIIMFVFGASLWDNFVHALDGQVFGTAGISFLGGVVLGVPIYAMLLFMVYRSKIPLRIILNSIVPSLVIAHAFGRIGCFCAGCCYGKPSSWAWGLIYPLGSLAAEKYGYGVGLIPTQLIESFYLFVLYFVFIFLIKQRRVMWYCILYGVYRFAAEFMRGDSRGTIAPWLSPSQLLSIILLLIALTIFLVQHFTKDNGLIPEGEHILKAKFPLPRQSSNSLFIIGKEEQPQPEEKQEEKKEE